MQERKLYQRVRIRDIFLPDAEQYYHRKLLTNMGINPSDINQVDRGVFAKARQRLFDPIVWVALTFAISLVMMVLFASLWGLVVIAIGMTGFATTAMRSIQVEMRTLESGRNWIVTKASQPEYYQVLRERVYQETGPERRIKIAAKIVDLLNQMHEIKAQMRVHEVEKDLGKITLHEHQLHTAKLQQAYRELEHEWVGVFSGKDVSKQLLQMSS